MTNGAIFDNAMMNDIETVGNAQISTSVKKYGTGSLSFDGTGDYLVAPFNTWTNFGTGPVTIEFWVNFSVMSGVRPLLSVRSGGGGGWGMYWFSNAISFVSVTTSTVDFATSAIVNTTGTWYHVAFVRNGTSYVTYINGTSAGTATSSNAINNDSSDMFSVGKPWPSGMTDFNGYIDDLRITKGYARYTANFTAPTAAFPNTGPI
jgi:hypothetical protein